MVDLARLTNLRLGELLQEEGLITQEQIQDTLDFQEDSDLRFGEALIAQNHVEERDIVWVLCTQFDIPYINVENYTPDPQAIEKVPPEFMEENSILPLELVDNTLVIVASGFFHREMFETLAQQTGLQIQLLLSPTESIQGKIKKHVHSS